MTAVASEQALCEWLEATNNAPNVLALVQILRDKQQDYAKSALQPGETEKEKAAYRVYGEVIDLIENFREVQLDTETDTA